MFSKFSRLSSHLRPKKMGKNPRVLHFCTIYIPALPFQRLLTFFNTPQRLFYILWRAYSPRFVKTFFSQCPHIFQIYVFSYVCQFHTDTEIKDKHEIYSRKDRAKQNHPKKSSISILSNLKNFIILKFKFFVKKKTNFFKISFKSPPLALLFSTPYFHIQKNTLRAHYIILTISRMCGPRSYLSQVPGPASTCCSRTLTHT